MKLTFRPGIFETNSSMIHTLIIGSRNDFDKWRNGDVFWFLSYPENPRFVTKEEKENLINEEGWSDSAFKSYAYFMLEEPDKYGNYSTNEVDSGFFTSPSGDEMEWLAAYGYDY